ncbi:MAG: PAS domain S-box protein [Gemmatimonadaceae bacterium]|nr:PAS domain S-box protein [Gemmatimonadaceae bacterium]
MDSTADELAGTPDRRVPRPEQVAAAAESALLQTLARQVPGVIYQYRLYPDGRSCFPFATDAMWDIYEFHPEDVRDDATPVFSRVHPDDVKAVSDAIAVSASTLEPWQQMYRVVLPVQGLRWRSGVARPERLDDGSILWHGFITDVTEQQEAKEALEASEARFRVQIEHAPEAIVVLDTRSRLFVETNPQAERLFGLSRQELLTRGPLDVSPEFQADGRPSAVSGPEYVREALEGGAPVIEWQYLRADGSVVFAEVRMVRLPSQTTSLVRGSITDITERLRAEADLRLRDQAIATSLNALLIADAKGMVHYVNPAFVNTFGVRDAAEVLGRPFAEIVGPEIAPVIMDVVREGRAWQNELQLARRDGAKATFQVAANGVHGADGSLTHLMIWVADVTEAKRLQEQFLQSQKMQTVGRLAGGMAHDFNNLLTVMKGYLELAQQQIPADSPLAADLAEVDRAASTAAGLTRQLLAFSRKQLLDSRPIDLNETVQQIHAMLKRLIGEDITVELKTDPALWPVLFDKAQAEQVLMNLAVNARDAMPHGGMLTIRTSNVKRPGVGRGLDDFVQLEVTDTGSGMSPEVRALVFEPFFTTKGAGRGTGLGLAMVYGAVTEHGGRVTVDSAPGLGSTFRILLPRLKHALGADAAHEAEQLPRGTETVMLVEDEDAIRALAARVLRKQGYTVHAYANGLDALTAFASLGDSVQLLLTDAVMPEMNGRELADAVRRTHPRIPIMFVSGYAEDVIASRGAQEAAEDFLPKPYSTAELVRRIREALDRPLAPAAPLAATTPA